MFHAATFLALHMYNRGHIRPFQRGIWTIDNQQDGEATMGLFVREGDQLVATARMDAQQPCGYEELTILCPDGERAAKLLLAEWVAENSAAVYPHKLGRKVPSLTAAAGL